MRNMIYKSILGCLTSWYDAWYNIRSYTLYHIILHQVTEY